LLLAVTLVGAGVATTMTRSGTAVRWFLDVGAVLTLFGETRLWVGANRTALAVRDAQFCCTSSSRFEPDVVLPATIPVDDEHPSVLTRS